MSLKLIPWKLLAYIAAGLLILAGLNHGLGFIPFTPQWSARRAAVKVENLEGQVSSLERTAEGNAAIGQAVQTYHTREVVYRDATSQAQTEARNAPDANTPLADDYAAVLRRADGILCQSGPCAPAAPVDAP